MANKVRVGYISGEAARINERVIDSQWISYLGEYVQLVRIPPFSILKCFGGSITQWIDHFPRSLSTLAERLADLTQRYDIQALYLNWTDVIPYVLQARNVAKLDLSILFITHCVGSERWLKQWVSIAPWLTKKDVLLTSTQTSKQALLNISQRYELAHHIPLCIQVPQREQEAAEIRPKNKMIFSIGRLEDVKNIDQLLLCYAQIRKQVPDSTLVVAGEYTGFSEQQVQAYKKTIESIVTEHDLQQSVIFTGPVEGQRKDELFQQADLLLNLSTDPGETFGFNIIEAKTWGVPVVCTYWDGFAELIQHGVDGFLIDCIWEDENPVFSQDQVISYSVRLLEDDLQRQQMGKRAFARAVTYDYRAIMPRVALALQQAVESDIEEGDSLTETIVTIACSKIQHLTGIYQSNVLVHPDLREHTPISILDSSGSVPLQDWMNKCKPFISHYAGRHG